MDRLLELHPDDEWGLTAKADALETGQLAEALAACDAALKLKPDEAYVLGLKADICKSCRPAEAVEVAEKFLSCTSPTPTSCRCWATRCSPLVA